MATNLAFDTAARSNNVVYVHGIGNQPTAETLKCQWDLALFGSEAGSPSRLAYWVNRDRYPVPLPVRCVDGDLTNLGAESIPAIDDTPDALDDSWLEAEVAQLTDDPRRRALLLRVGTRLIRADADRSADSSGAVLPLPKFLRRWITKRLTSLFLRDVYDFLYDKLRRDVMCSSLRNLLTDNGGPYLVVAHSLGSVIAYNVLATRSGATADIALLLTIGSPLGIQEIQDELATIVGTPTLAVPANVQRWLNVADRLDPVAIDLTLRDDFVHSGPVAVEDWQRQNADSPGNPHSATGYLEIPELREVVRRARQSS